MYIINESWQQLEIHDWNGQKTTEVDTMQQRFPYRVYEVFILWTDK